jgi:S-methylmethionine-dependent homocysteine/selenocysteine methylase
MDALNAKAVDQHTTSGQKSTELQQQHAKLVAQLRDHIANKNQQIKELTVCVHRYHKKF